MRQSQVATHEKPHSLLNPFERSDEVFAELKMKLRASEAMAMTHARLEDFVQSDGMQLLRQLFEDHLALRSQREQDLGWADLTPSDGVDRPHERDSSRQLATLFGEVRVERTAYGNRGAPRACIRSTLT
jgi:hypothetical protein